MKIRPKKLSQKSFSDSYIFIVDRVRSDNIYLDCSLSDLRSQYIEAMQVISEVQGHKEKESICFKDLVDSLKAKKEDIKAAVQVKQARYRDKLLMNEEVSEKSTDDQVVAAIENMIKELEGNEEVKLKGLLSYDIRFNMKYYQYLKFETRLQELKSKL